MDKANTVKILFFATLRDYVGVRSLEMEIPAQTSVGGLKEILIRGRGREWNHVEATVDGGVRNLPVSFSIRGNEEAGQVRITGRTELSLAKLGVREIKGPLGAFKVKDAVEVLFEIILRPPG